MSGHLTPVQSQGVKIDFNSAESISKSFDEAQALFGKDAKLVVVRERSWGNWFSCLWNFARKDDNQVSSDEAFKLKTVENLGAFEFVKTDTVMTKIQALFPGNAAFNASNYVKQESVGLGKSHNHFKVSDLRTLSREIKIEDLKSESVEDRKRILTEELSKLEERQQKWLEGYKNDPNGLQRTLLTLKSIKTNYKEMGFDNVGDPWGELDGILSSATEYLDKANTIPNFYLDPNSNHRSDEQQKDFELNMRYAVQAMSQGKRVMDFIEQNFPSGTVHR